MTDLDDKDTPLFYQGYILKSVPFGSDSIEIISSQSDITKSLRYLVNTRPIGLVPYKPLTERGLIPGRGSIESGLLNAAHFAAYFGIRNS
jgi:hypothetical protein